MIAAFGATTHVGQGPGEPGECASACVLAYLGGDYRYLHPNSKIGVHQFAYIGDDNLSVGIATSITQAIAAEIIQFITERRADTNFYSLMAGALPSELFFVPHDKLRELRVVTDHIWDETWTFEFLDGGTYLRIWQQSKFGENKLVLMCDSGQLVGAAFLEPSTPHSLGILPHTVAMIIDSDLRTIADDLVIRHPWLAQRFATATFVISPKLAGDLLRARSIGAAMQPPNNSIFFGFQIDTSKGRDKLFRFVTGCK